VAKEKRMLSNKIYDQDEFLDMPATARDLYTYLNLSADDEGFVGNTKSIMRKTRASEDDLKILLAKRFLLSFDNGKSVVVIKHWLIHNTIRQDRVIPTTYVKEKETLTLNEYGAYTEKRDDTNLFDLIENDSVRQVSDTCPPNLILSNLKESISISNNIYNKDNNSSSDTKLLEIKEIIDYLNEKLEKRYTYRNTTFNSHIRGRLKDGFTVNDFKEVIDKKYDEWFGTDWEKYLTPDTLFRPGNFEKYLNQKINKKVKKAKEYQSFKPDEI